MRVPGVPCWCGGHHPVGDAESGPIRPSFNSQLRVEFRGATVTFDGLVTFARVGRTAEQWIKEGKTATHWTRLSCHRFRANEVRLLLGGIAYNLGNLLRRLVLPLPIQDW